MDTTSKVRRSGASMWTAGIGVLCVVPAVLAATNAHAEPITPSAAAVVDRSDKAAVRAAYLRRLKPALAVSARWSGSVAACRAGAASSTTQSSTLAALNFYRAMGQLDPVRLDSALSAKAQQAALMMDVNHSLSHSPPSSWKCYTTTGATAAGSSNLALGAAGARSIGLYMDDPGASNTAAGHRRWILNPPTSSMGSGSTASANALWIFGKRTTGARTPSWLPWPTSGYFPTQIEPGGRWSLGATAAGVDVRRATVTVVGPSGKKLRVKVHPVASGYGPETLVWNVTGIVHPKGSSVGTYRVTVAGMKRSGKPLTYSYRVRLFDAEHS